MDNNTTDNQLSRRDFIKTSAAVGGGLAIAASPLSVVFGSSRKRKKYAIVGTSGRSRMYQQAILKEYGKTAELVGLCDLNEGRLRLAQSRAKKMGAKNVPIYAHTQFDNMITETKPDVVIVTTMDSTHDEYIVRGMELGCDVITEKPMTTDADKCQRIVDTQRKTGRICTVTFNYRYSPPRTQVKDLLMSGLIGEPLSVDFHWMLNTHHGADYFRRWHSQKKFSGGLMVHKATHHFDLVNWWLSAIPVSVFATGKREFYTPDMAKRLGLSSYHERCHTCPEKSQCGFELDIEANPKLKELYLDNEQYDGYFRDRCVFRPDIDIEDTMNVIVGYDNKTTMSYSLNAFNAWEGYYIVFNGTKGRIEHSIEEKVYVNGTDSEQGGIKKGGTRTKIIPLRDAPYEVETWSGEGGHGGGDKVLLDDLFGASTAKDKYLRAADYRSGAYSILIGVAANKSIASGQEIQIADLVTGLDYPDYPEMPLKTGQLPMPGKTGKYQNAR
ncbi:Gfo/Idh/MocA family oxidoreductase [Candidatus Neomarinimicrobiota bacterium]